MSGFLSVLVSYGATITKAAFQKLIASDSASQADALFGSAAAISGDGNYIVIGSYMAGATDTGAAYVYYNNNGTWEEQAKLVASNAVAGDWFGCAVDITKTGDRIIIGAQHANALPYNQNDSGAAYIFKRTGTTWTEEVYISGGDGGSNDYFGNSVAINDDGTEILVGAYGDDSGSTTSVGYIHTYIQPVGGWSTLNWKSDDDELPTTATEGSAYHGWSIACNSAGDRCIEGGPGDNNQGKTNCGVVTIHHRILGVSGWKHVSNSAWGSIMNTYAVWNGPYTANTDKSVSVVINFPISGDYIFGYKADNSITWSVDGGASITYSGYTGSATTTTKTLTSGDHTLNLSIHNASGSTGNPAGGAMTITDPGGNIFWSTLDLVTTTWTKDIWLEPPYPINDGQFGWSVAMDGAGDRVVIGEIGGNPQGVIAGAAYVYKRSGTVWSLEQQLFSSDNKAGDKFGYSVSINAAGNKIAVGTINADIPTKTNVGAVYVFDLSGTTWSQSNKLLATDAATDDNLGYSVSLNSDGTGVVTGSPNNDVNSISNAGAAYYFPLTATTPFVPADPHWSNVILLITADNGTQGNNTFIDVSKNNIPLTVHSAVVIDTNIKKFGTGSMHFPTSGDFLSMPLIPILNLTGIFTIETWLYPTSFSSVYGCIIICDTWELAVDSASHNGRLAFSYTNTSWVYGPDVPLNQWSHVAAVYDGTQVTVYVNGIGGTPVTIPGLSANVNVNQIGCHASGSTWQYYGYMDELRLTKGVARYTGNFTPPTNSFYS